MRIKITFRNAAENTVLPINTNFYLARLLNQLTREYHHYLSSLLPPARSNHFFDMYTFSQLIIPNRKIISDKIGILSERFFWYVASPYPQFLGIVARKLRDRSRASIDSNMFPIERISFIRSPAFRNSRARFTCLSPIAVYRQTFKNRHHASYQFKGGYILPDEKGYHDFVERDLLYKYNVLQGKKRNHLNFNLEFDQNYIRKRKNRITKVITLERGTRDSEQIKGVLAPFQIKADPDVLRLIYDAGLGQLNSFGFGMVETV